MSYYTNLRLKQKNTKSNIPPQRVIYPKNLIGTVLYACILKYLSVDELELMNECVMLESSISNAPLEKYIIENHIQKLKNSPINPDDFIIYNYLLFKKKLKTKDLIIKYYDNHVRGHLNEILPHVEIKQKPSRKIKAKSNPLQLKLEF